MCDFLKLKNKHSVLEPSAGAGGMVKIINEYTENVTCIELNKKTFNQLNENVVGIKFQGDFLNFKPNQLSQFDFVIMCPPANSASHIKHARRFLNKGGKLVALVRKETIANFKFQNWISLPNIFRWNGRNIECGVIYEEF